jgi:murein DD-endopeptidase MepM/ murein hydrolase activator NlpD
MPEACCDVADDGHKLCVLGFRISDTLARGKPMTSEKNAILAQKAPHLTRSCRHISPRWLAVVATLPLLGGLAAFGIAPSTSTDPVVLQRVLQDVPLVIPQPDENAPPAEYYREERIQRGDTLGSLLARLHIDDEHAASYLRSARHVRALYQLVPGRTVRAVTSEDGELVSMRYLNGDGTELVVQRRGNDFFARELPLVTEQRLLMSSGEVRTSLFSATDAAGLSDSVAVQLADIFSGEIDFHRDLRPGDRFAVVFEAFYSNGEFVRTGRIVAAEFVNAGFTHRALYYQDAAGHGGYYTPDGRNMRKSFLRSPLEFSRISSGFSLSRFHPVLQSWRAHKGVDYAAATGTRVKATADGYVQFAGHQGGYGKLVVLRHMNGYTTAYGHLSAFAKGLRAGQRISQGDVIGYVGSTGLATGPHLHYEFRVNGLHQNPLRASVPQGPAITAQLRPSFEEGIQPLLSQLKLIHGIDVAASN